MIDLKSLGLDGPEPSVERIEVTQPLELVTSRWQNWREEAGVPVGITVGRPRFVRYNYLTIKALAPWELMKPPLKGIDDIPIERRVYRRRLAAHEQEILGALNELAQTYPGLPAVLMCFEDVLGKDGPDGCHRRWVAQWWQERYGWDVPELAARAGAAPAQPRKPKPEQPPTLF